MEKYHFRRPEKMIQNRDKMVEVIKSQKYMTLAMTKDNEPYLVTLSYAFDERRNCFYFHCAHQGKKIDYLQANPLVWGQVLDDRGYMHGKCNHAFLTVQFKGNAEKVTDIEEIRYALHLLIEQLEDDPEPVKKRFEGKDITTTAAIIRVQIQGMSGKTNLSTDS